MAGGGLTANNHRPTEVVVISPLAAAFFAMLRASLSVLCTAKPHQDDRRYLKVGDSKRGSIDATKKILKDRQTIRVSSLHQYEPAGGNPTRDVADVCYDRVVELLLRVIRAMSHSVANSLHFGHHVRDSRYGRVERTAC